MTGCNTCENWGRTVLPGEIPVPIACPSCGRLTWPNLGVNLPAGGAGAYASMCMTAYVYASQSSEDDRPLGPDSPAYRR